MLLSEWLTIATEGDTIDNREIKASWIKEAAEKYDREFYTAVIDADHELEWYGSFGAVHELREGKNKEGKAILEGRIAPNIRLVQMVQNGQRLWFSCWFVENFANTGSCYLFRLAVTDTPASTGTSQLKFSVNKPITKHDAITNTAPFEIKISEEKGGILAFAKRVVEKFSALPESHQTENQTDEHTMTPEQLQQITDQFSKLNDAIAGITETQKQTAEQFTALTEKLEALTPEQEQETETDPQGGEGSEQFAALKTQLDELTNQFTALLNTPNGNQNIPNNDGSDIEAVRGI